MGSEADFRALFDKAYPALRRYAWYRNLTKDDAEDLVAGTFEVAWRRIQDVPRDDPMPSRASRLRASASRLRPFCGKWRHLRRPAPRTTS